MSHLISVQSGRPADDFSCSAQVSATEDGHITITGPTSAQAIRYSTDHGATWITLDPATDLPCDTGTNPVLIRVEGAVREYTASPTPPVAAGAIPDQLWTTADPVELDVAADFTGTGITYTLAPLSADLPAGLSLSAAGVISGTPLADSAAVLVVRGTNVAGHADTEFGYEITTDSGITLTKNVRILFSGDSTSVGVGADPTGATDIQGARPYSPPLQAMEALRAIGISAAADTFSSDNNVVAATLPLYRTDVSLIGAPGTSSRTPTGGGNLYRPAAGSYISLTTSEPVDSFVIGFPRATGLGVMQVLIDDVAYTTFNQNDAANDYHFETITGLTPGIHKISTTTLSGASHGPASIWAYDSTKTQAHVFNMGARNWRTSDWVKSTYATSPLPSLGALQPDIVVIDIGINDYRQSGTTIATVTANIQAMIDMAEGAGASVILAVPNPIATYNTATDAWSQAAVLTMYQSLATANPDTVLVNMPEKYFEGGLSAATNPATFAALNAAGHMYDTTHPKGSVYAVEGVALAEAIFAVITARGWIAP